MMLFTWLKGVCWVAPLPIQPSPAPTQTPPSGQPHIARLIPSPAPHRTPAPLATLPALPHSPSPSNPAKYLPIAGTLSAGQFWQLCRRVRRAGGSGLWLRQRERVCPLGGVLPYAGLGWLGIGSPQHIHFCLVPANLAYFLQKIYPLCDAKAFFSAISAKILPKFCQSCQIPAKRRVRLRSVLVAFAKRQRSNMDLYCLADFRDCLSERVWVG